MFCSVLSAHVAGYAATCPEVLPVGWPDSPCNGRAGAAGGFNHGADGSKLVLRLSAACERGCTVFAERYLLCCAVLSCSVPTLRAGFIHGSITDADFLYSRLFVRP